MMIVASIALFVLAVPVDDAARREDPAPVPATKPAAVLVPGTRVRLAPPAGHEPGRGFLGYQWPESAASLMVIETPASYAESAKGFDAQGLAKGGMELLEAADVRISGRDARLLFVKQESQGISFQKWLAVLGNEKRTLLVTAVFPAEVAGEFLAPMKAALLGLEWDPTLEVDPFAVLTWTVAKPEGLRFAGNMGTSLMWTEDGELVQKDSPDSARTILSPSMGEVKVDDPKAFAEKRLRQLPFKNRTKIEVSQEYAAGSRKGWEIVATAKPDKDSDREILVHQVLLVGEGEYHLFVSQCGVATREKWLPRFRACAASWKQRAAPTDAPK